MSTSRGDHEIHADRLRLYVSAASVRTSSPYYCATPASFLDIIESEATEQSIAMPAEAVWYLRNLGTV